MWPIWDLPDRTTSLYLGTPKGNKNINNGLGSPFCRLEVKLLSVTLKPDTFWRWHLNLLCHLVAGNIACLVELAGYYHGTQCLFWALFRLIQISEGGVLCESDVSSIAVLFTQTAIIWKREQGPFHKTFCPLHVLESFPWHIYESSFT